MQTKTAVRIDSSKEILNFIVLAVLPRNREKRQENFPGGLSARNPRRDDQILILSGGSNRPFQFQKRGQLFIGAHNETPSVVTVRVCNPERSPVGIDR